MCVGGWVGVRGAFEINNLLMASWFLLCLCIHTHAVMHGKSLQCVCMCGNIFMT